MESLIPLVLTAAGIVAFILLTIMVVAAKFYVKVDQGKALIKNPYVGEPRVSFTGAWVWPVINRREIMDISVKTIELDRRGQNGLICKDNIRADIKVTFFVRVNKTSDDVLRVAQRVGVVRASDQHTLEELFMAKFSEALKSVGKQMDFVDLYNQRAQFKDSIVSVIGTDLDGYVISDAAIDYLEQSPIEMLDPDNILDAQGRRKIIDLTSQQKVNANEIQRDAEKTIKKQDVEAREAILALERQQEEAEAIQQREVENVRAREQAEMTRVSAEERRRGEDAEIAADQELGIARQNQQREIEVAEQNRKRAVAVEVERVEKERQLEVINRERAVDLSRIEKDKALETEKKHIADVVRERVAVEKTVAEEEERIKDLRAIKEADRQKVVAVTKATEEADARKLAEVKLAEAAEQAAIHHAKEKVTLADAEQAAAEKQAMAEIRLAEGRQASAAAEGLAQAKVKEADAMATEKVGKAEAEAIRAKMEAEAAGLTDKADAMAKLDENTRAHEEFRLRIETDLAIAREQIAANIDVARENARILATALGTAKIDIVGGDGQFFDRFVNAIGVGKSIDATVDNSQTIRTLGKEYLDGDASLPQDIKQVLSEGKFGTGDIKNLMSTAVLGKLLAGKDPDKVQALLAKAKELGFGDEISGWLSSNS